MVTDDMRQVFAELNALRCVTERLLTESLFDMPEERRQLVIANLRGAVRRSTPPRAANDEFAELTADVMVRAQTCIENIVDRTLGDPRLAKRD